VRLEGFGQLKIPMNSSGYSHIQSWDILIYKVGIFSYTKSGYSHIHRRDILIYEVGIFSYTKPGDSHIQSGYKLKKLLLKLAQKTGRRHLLYGEYACYCRLNCSRQFRFILLGYATNSVLLTCSLMCHVSTSVTHVYTSCLGVCFRTNLVRRARMSVTVTDCPSLDSCTLTRARTCRQEQQRSLALRR
jgi:hypothetical protein